jgi:hypothetical protein
LIDNPKPGKGGRDYLAIIDARGPRKARAYFTAWHELAHLLLYPPRQLVLEGCRRTPTDDAKQKDPVESAVDQIAGLLAFWEPLFMPALLANKELTFEAIGARRQRTRSGRKPVRCQPCGFALAGTSSI